MKDVVTEHKRNTKDKSKPSDCLLGRGLTQISLDERDDWKKKTQFLKHS